MTYGPTIIYEGRLWFPQWDVRDCAAMLAMQMYVSTRQKVGAEEGLSGA